MKERFERTGSTIPVHDTISHMVELSHDIPRVEKPSSRKDPIPWQERQKPAEVAVSIRPTIAMEKHSPEAIKAKKIAKEPLPALWGSRAEFLPATAEFMKRCGVIPENVSPVPLGEGLTNVVFAYKDAEGHDKVIKIARQIRKGFMSTGFVQDAENIALVHKYFGAYSVPTEIHQDPETGKYLILQDKMTGKPLTSDLETTSIRAQLVDLARLNREMMRQTGHSLDFIGMPGFMTWLRHSVRAIFTGNSVFQISNIHIDQMGRLKIIDEGLLRFKEVPLKQKLISQMGFLTNRLIMRLYFGVDLLGRK